jgi:hypothetical protein
VIEIRERHFGGYKTKYNISGHAVRTEEYTVYVVVQDNKRIDSFLKKRNARRCAARLAGLLPAPPAPTVH